MLQVLLVRGNSWISDAIRLETWAPWTHAALLINGTVYEAQVPVVRALPYVAWHVQTRAPVDAFFLKWSLNKWQEDKVETFCKSHLGDHYCIGRLFFFLPIFRLIIGALRIKEPRHKGWFCSRFITVALLQAGVQLQERIDTDRMSPGLVGISPLLTPAV